MSEILICAMGRSPGVVTKMTQYLQQEAKRQPAEVWVVFTANQTITDLYNHVLRKEFDDQLRLKDKHYPKMFSPADVRTKQQVEQFFRELAALLKEKLAPENAVVDLCISGGRKSMTYAAAMAVQAVAAEMGEAVTSQRLHVWHVQLEREEEPSLEDVQELLKNYQSGFVSLPDRERILYPRDATIIEVPFFHFEQPQRVERQQGRYRFSRAR